MAKILNTGAIAPKVEAPQPVDNSGGQLSPELLQQIAASGIDPNTLIAQLQQSQQNELESVAPIVNPIDDLNEGMGLEQESNVIPINPMLSDTGLNPPVNEPQTTPFSFPAKSSNQRILDDVTGLPVDNEALAAGQIAQAQTEESLRAEGSIGFKQKTREEFEEAYSNNLMPTTIGSLYRTAFKIGEGGVSGVYKIKDPQGILPSNMTPIELVSKGVKASPVEATNATTFAFVNMAAALSARQGAIDSNSEVKDDDILGVMGLLTGETALDERGRVIIDAEKLDGIFANYTKGSLNRVRNSDIGNLDQPGLIGNAQAQMMRNAGLLEEIFYQPQDAQNNIIDTDSIPKRGYQLTNLGANVSYELKEINNNVSKREYSETNETKEPGPSKSINQPMARRRAVKVHGDTPGSSIGAFNLRRVKPDKASGKRTSKATASYKYVEALRQSPVRMNKRVLSVASTMINLFEEADQIKRANGSVTEAQQNFIDNITSMLALEKVITDKPGSPSKLLKAKRDLSGAMAVEGFVKRHYNPHPASNRTTNDTADVNEQESPRIHKGAMEGVPRSYVLTDLKNKSDSDTVISLEEYNSWKSWLDRPSKPTVAIQKTAMLWALGSWMVPGTRTNSDKYLFQNFTMSNLKSFARSGDLLKAFVNKPEEVISNPQLLSELNSFIEEHAGIDKGKSNGFFIKSAFIASDIIDALNRETRGLPVGLNFSPVPPSADASSAGKTLAAFDQGDYNTIEHVGLLYDPARSGTNMFPNGSPRAFFLKTVMSGLNKPGYIRGLLPVQQRDIANALTPRGNSEEAFAEFANDLAKVPLMISDYGKSRHFMHGPARKFLSKRPDLEEVFNNIAFDTDNYNSGVDLLNAVISQGLAELSNSWYSRGIKNQAMAAGLLGFNLTGELSDGSTIRIGVKEYFTLDDSGYQFVGADGEVTTAGQLSERTPRDAPLARSKEKLDKDTKELLRKRLGSYQVNQSAPLFGHLREVENNALAHEEVSNILQDPDVFISNIHDNVYGDPVYMALFQKAVAKSLRQIAGHDIQKTVTDSFIADVAKTMSRIKAMPNEIVIGSNSKDPALSGWLEYLDELYKEFQENSLKEGDLIPEFKFLNDINRNRLLDAYDNGNGIWRPLDKPGIKQTIDGVVLKAREPSETVAMVVSKNKLESFIARHLLNPIIGYKTKADRALDNKEEILKEYDSLIKNGQGWMKVGR